MISKPTLENLDREELLKSSRRLLAEAQALSSRIAAINEIATAINRKLDLDEILRVVGKQAKWVLDFEHCSVCIRKGQGWQVKVLFGPVLTVPDPYVPEQGSILERTLCSGQAQLIRDGSAADYLRAYTSQILIPLQSEDQILGTINFAKTRKDFYTGEDLRVGYLLAQQLSLAMRNALVLEELKQAHDELERRNQELDAYSHTIAHDLKTPLQTIVLFDELLLTTLGSTVDEKTQERLQHIKQVALRMGKMIDQLLWLARLRDAAATSTNLNVKKIADAAILRLRPAINAKQIEITVQVDLPDAVGHEQWVEEIFANLIGNAVKYIGKENAQPKIAVNGRIEGDFARYEIRDNGIGIEPAAQARLFEMFSRLHSTEADGLGLGLSIVRRIATQLNGKVGVESIPGQGSVFWFTLPVARVVQGVSP